MATKNPKTTNQTTNQSDYHANNLVVEFHQAFGHPVETEPTTPDIADRAMRVKLIAEELLELADASGVMLNIQHGRIHVEPKALDICDLVEVADALGDIRYLVDGANLVYGIPGDQVLREIHRSNMTKLGADGKPVYREDGKIMKGPNYERPNIDGVFQLSKLGWM